MPHLIVFSHLRWDFVFQRPQHLMTRLARRFPVVFVEEPVRGDGPPRLERTVHAPGVEVWVPHTPVEAPGFHDDQLALLQPLRRRAAARAGHRRPHRLVLHADGAAAGRPRRRAALVYDCMDELSAFRNAPRQLRQREAALLQQADVVLTGGPALYAAKRGLQRQRALPAELGRCGALRRRRGSTRRAPRRPRPTALQGAIAHGRGSASSASSTSGSTSNSSTALARRAARLADRDVRPGGEDRSARPAAPRQPALARHAALRPAAAPDGRLGRLPDAVRAERVDALHQPDQDARVHGRRQAGGQHRDRRRDRPLRRRGAHRERPRRLRRRLRRRAGRGRGAARRAARRHGRRGAALVLGRERRARRRRCSMRRWRAAAAHLQAVPIAIAVEGVALPVAAAIHPVEATPLPARSNCRRHNGLPSVQATDHGRPPAEGAGRSDDEPRSAAPPAPATSLAEERAAGETVLIVIDMFSRWDYDGADRLLAGAERIAPAIAALRRRCREAGVPVVYANDNAGRWRSDFGDVVRVGARGRRCRRAHRRTAGARQGRLFRPQAQAFGVLRHAARPAAAPPRRAPADRHRRGQRPVRRLHRRRRAHARLRGVWRRATASPRRPRSAAAGRSTSSAR